MRQKRPDTYRIFLLTVLLCLGMSVHLSAQSKKSAPPSASAPAQPTAQTRYKVEGGILKEIKVETPADSLVKLDSTVTDLQEMPVEIDSAALSKKKRKREEADTSVVRYSKLFRDTIPISRVIALSLPLPGFSQVYNKQAWKVPILYGVTGTLAYFGFQQNKQYIRLRDNFESLQATGTDRSVLNPVQREMIVKNTTRSLLFVGAIASYMYFLGDGVMNYNGPATDAKKATTLSMICPGAGQIYNRSYWKTPIIVGAFATMAYVIDYNSRGYNRYRRAYQLRTDGNDNTVDEFANQSWVTEDYLKTLKNNFRRNRDLCIIIAAGLYILNVIDAHVDANLKDYDISDDLAFTVEPTLMQYYTRNNTPANGLGLSFKLRF